MIIRENYLKKIRQFYNKNIIKVITGIRRSGKSTILLQIIDELKAQGVTSSAIIFINFDKYENSHLKDPNKLHEYLIKNLVEDQKTYIFLDEIQEVINFENVINSLIIDKDVDIYITGSNSKMLQSEYSTYLTGRYVSFEIFPLSFKEYYSFYVDLDKEKAFFDYVNFGGFPQLIQFETNNEKITLLKDLYNSIVINDITNRYNIKNIYHLEKYLLFLMNNISNLFSAKNILNFFQSEKIGISLETLYNYIKYAKNVFFLYAAQRYDIKGKKILSTNEKIFVNDQGFRGLFNNNQKDIEKILENIIYFELLRRGYDVKVGKIDDSEVDFIAIKGPNKTYFQITYLLASENTIKREFGSLLSIFDQYPKFVLSMDKVNMSHEGIIHKNIIDFLLEDE